MTNYEKFREVAIELTQRQPENYPCRRCESGDCCKKDNVSVTAWDAEIIAKAIYAKNIPDAVKDIAINNALNEKRAYCPFFDELPKAPFQHCTIYRYRPIACVYYGIGAAISPEEFEKAYGLSVANKRDMGIKVHRSGGWFMHSADCLERLFQVMDAIPLKDITDAIQVENFILSNFTVGMRRLVLELRDIRFIQAILNKNDRVYYSRK